ncbi:MAG: hypothetical protein EU536_02735 [Promethearchaeota archaeon]|nr:MAG: hypothetical protein EU536_02735 [Candidatus Lokiarchaeota archaeon]
MEFAYSHEEKEYWNGTAWIQTVIVQELPFEDLDRNLRLETVVTALAAKGHVLASVKFHMQVQLQEIGCYRRFFSSTKARI